MSPADFPKLVALLLAASIGLEVTLLAGVFTLDTFAYHSLHLLCMGVLAGGQLLVWRYARTRGLPAAGAALALAVGAAFTASGDYVNGALSGVEPVSQKLSWALLLFGAGYTLYVVTLWRHAGAALHARAPRLHALRYAVLPLILGLNVAAWFRHVEPGAAGPELLYYGSFVFNATLYVALPAGALWLAVATRFSTGALLVLIGAILIPYSDLVLFDTWLRGNPPVPSFTLYACNWVVYFGGQALFALLPSVLMTLPEAGDTSPPRVQGAA